MKAVESLGVKYDGEGLDYFFSLPAILKEKDLPADLKPPETNLPINLPSNLKPLKGEINLHSNLNSDVPTEVDEIFKNKIEKKLGIKLEREFHDKSEDNLEESKSPQTQKEINYIAFVIGGAHATKRLPTEKIISICKKIKQSIILLGGKDDATTGEEIVLTIKNKRTIYNACGKLTLAESAWVVKEANKVITHDTGMMHIAAAFQKEIISIWGNTIPEFGMYPFYKKGVKLNRTIQVENLTCRPCSKIGFDKCPKGHFKCMTEINEVAIIKALSD